MSNSMMRYRQQQYQPPVGSRSRKGRISKIAPVSEGKSSSIADCVPDCSQRKDDFHKMRIAIISSLAITLGTVLTIQNKSYNSYLKPGSRRITTKTEPQTYVYDDPSKLEFALHISYPDALPGYLSKAIELSSNTPTAENSWIESQGTMYSSFFDGYHNLGPFTTSTMGVSDRLVVTTSNCGEWKFCLDECSSNQYDLISAKRFQSDCYKTKVITEDKELIGEGKIKPGQVRKVVHSIMNPMDNVVSRFLANREESDFDPTATEFMNWCKSLDESFSLHDMELLKEEDRATVDRFRKIPCKSEFYRYVLWHNHAFNVAQSGLVVTAMSLRMEDFQDNSKASIAKLLQFLGVQKKKDVFLTYPTISQTEDFFSDEQQILISSFLKALSSEVTWDHIQDYFTYFRVKSFEKNNVKEVENNVSIKKEPNSTTNLSKDEKVLAPKKNETEVENMRESGTPVTYGGMSRYGGGKSEGVYKPTTTHKESKTISDIKSTINKLIMDDEEKYMRMSKNIVYGESKAEPKSEPKKNSDENFEDSLNKIILEDEKITLRSAYAFPKTEEGLNSAHLSSNNNVAKDLKVTNDKVSSINELKKESTVSNVRKSGLESSLKTEQTYESKSQAMKQINPYANKVYENRASSLKEANNGQGSVRVTLDKTSVSTDTESSRVMKKYNVLYNSKAIPETEKVVPTGEAKIAVSAIKDKVGSAPELERNSINMNSLQEKKRIAEEQKANKLAPQKSSSYNTMKRINAVYQPEYTLSAQTNAVYGESTSSTSGRVEENTVTEEVKPKSNAARMLGKDNPNAFQFLA